MSALPLFAHAVLAGGVLAALTERATRDPEELEEGVLAASNVLFLCVAMAAVMVLVSDSVARAFAIGAAIALVRFRVKVEGKFIGTGLLYGVIAGMACGVGRPAIAWTVCALFALMLGGVMFVRGRVRSAAAFRPAAEPLPPAMPEPLPEPPAYRTLIQHTGSGGSAAAE